jgi:hypothetical protein
MRMVKDAGCEDFHAPGWGEMRMSKYEQIIELLSDGEWHTKEDLGQVTSFPELWLDELRHEPEVTMVSDDETVRVKLGAAA